MADSDSNVGVHDNVKCLSGVDMSNYELIRCTKDGFFCCAKVDGQSAKSSNVNKMSSAGTSDATSQTASTDRSDQSNPGQRTEVTGQTGYPE